MSPPGKSIELDNISSIAAPPSAQGEETLSLREDLLAIIAEIVGNQRTVLIENLLPIARKRTGAETLAIENVLVQLKREKQIIPGSRIMRKVVLRNPTRKEIYELIRQQPGINYTSIKASLQLGSNAVLWHLSILLKFGCIQEIHYKIFTLFALPELTPNEVILPILLENDLIRGILKSLYGKTLSVSDLVELLSVRKKKIYYHLKSLQELSIVEKSPKDGVKTSFAYKMEPAIEELYLNIILNEEQLGKLNT